MSTDNIFVLETYDSPKTVLEKIVNIALVILLFIAMLFAFGTVFKIMFFVW